MNFGFLGNLGRMIGSGAKAGFGALKSGIGQLGEMEDEDEGYGFGGNNGGDSGGFNLPALLKQRRSPVPMTPGFNPNASMPDMRRVQPGRDDGLINRPQPMQTQTPPMMPQDAPKFEPIRDSVNISASNSGPIGGSDTLGSMMDQRANAPASVSPQQVQMVPERQESPLRIPNFYGGKGAYKEDDPINRAQYDYETQYMKDGHIPRRWQDIAKNAVLALNQGFQATGDWRGGLMGAAVGGVGSAIDPLHGRGYQFQQAVQPGLEAEQKRLQQGRSESMRMKREKSDLEHQQAQTRRINQPGPPPGYADAGWGTYNRATGKPEYIRPSGTPSTAAPRRYRVGDDLVDETGRVVYKGTPRPSAEQRPMEVAPGSTVIDPKTGREIYKAAPKPREMSREAREAQAGVSQMKRDADAAWSKAKREKDPAKRAELEDEARYYQEEYNSAAFGLAEDFPEDFEAGEGEGNWAYTKPKGSTPTIKRGGGKQGGTAKLSELTQKYLK